MKKAEKTPETLRFSGVFLVPYYTIPKIKRELKPLSGSLLRRHDYTKPKIKRELKPSNRAAKIRPNYTKPKIKRELKHAYVCFRIFSHYTTLYAAYAKPISTFEELQNVNLAPYENYVLTNDIIAGGARGARAGYVRGRRAGRAYLLSKRKNDSGEHTDNRAGGEMVET